MSVEYSDELSSSTSLHDTCREMLHSLAECQCPRDFLGCMAKTFGLLGDSMLSNKVEYNCNNVDGKGQVSGKDAFVTLRLCVQQLQRDEKDVVSWVRTWWYSNYFDEFASILLNGRYMMGMLVKNMPCLYFCI